MEDKASPMGVTPNNSQHIYFTSITTGDFSPVALGNFDRLFSVAREPISFMGCCSHSQQHNFRDISHIDFSLPIRRKKKLYLPEYIFIWEVF